MNRRSILAALLAVPILGAAKCQQDPNLPPPKPEAGAAPAPREAQPDLSDQYWVLTLSAWIEPEFGPYTVTADAHDLTTDEKINLIDTPTEQGIKLPGGKLFVHDLAYPAHHRVEINMHVQATKPGSQKGFMAVRLNARRGGRKTEIMGGLGAKSLRTLIG